MNAADSLIEKVDEKKSPIVVGLDPRVEYLPRFIVDPCISEFGETRRAMAESFVEFNRAVIDQIEHEVGIVKPQVAFYEQLGASGFGALTETIEYAKGLGLKVILDAKRNDIGATAQAYSNAYLGRILLNNREKAVFDVDFLTVNPYLGTDGIRPFVADAKRYNKGIFVLVRTSNPSSEEFQGLGVGGKRLHDFVLEKVAHWGRGTVGSRGYSSVGAAVGKAWERFRYREGGTWRARLPSTRVRCPRRYRERCRSSLQQGWIRCDSQFIETDHVCSQISFHPEV